MFLLRYKNSFSKIAVNSFSWKKNGISHFFNVRTHGVWRNFEDLKPVLKTAEQVDVNNCKHIRLLQWFHVSNPQQRQLSEFRNVGVIGLSKKNLHKLCGPLFKHHEKLCTVTLTVTVICQAWLHTCNIKWR